ncbi:hypothetical protein P171DRAFT_435728 [Karstenula rhodostoma CBS 690.94]|uniref:Zn(2)-C6 fungal-type domain-containing protein n=1 Tax=Karstenula rhodostoma CBS 690.94 TaxID=1392251 RepID=A0A9P4U768_9PLEO|nr:hypothetical protein P171DRAFT_435728 [Karstenula rhodostoma CBS 690.94]
MTRTGKCDTCRSRKVKCDEQRPKCGACRKRDRDCTYSFGKASAFVLEDPTQLSKHGKPKVAPVIYPLEAAQEPNMSSTTPATPSPLPHSPPSTSLVLRQSTSRDADTGQGVFKTLSVLPRDRTKVTKKTTAQQRRKLQIHLSELDARALAMPRQFLPSPTALAARYLDLLGSRPPEEQPFSILGSWVESLPSRIGKNPAVDLAVEYLVESFKVYRDPSFSAQRAALATKARAIEELQLAVRNEKTRRSYDTAVATKIHFMAEVFMGIKNLYHAIHAAGLSDIMQAGPVTDPDEQYFWSFLDNAYYDDVSEAMVASRTSVYDHEVYLEMTTRVAIPKDAPATFRASVALMHVYIQVPRLICLVRHASNYPKDSRALTAAVALAACLWALAPSDVMQEIIQSSVTVVDIPPSPAIADIIPNSYRFNSIENSTLITRFWQLQVVLSGIVQTLYQNFPAECASSQLPSLPAVEKTDADAATKLARCIHWALTICPSLPLVPLRIYTTFQASVGAWYRITRRITASNRTPPPYPDPYPSVTAYSDEQLFRAKRMEQFVTDQSNNVHEIWNIPRVNKRLLRAVAIGMAGGPIPDWMPIRINFDSEDGEIVMKMEYEVAGPLYDKILGHDNGTKGWVRRTRTNSPFQPGTSEQMPGKGFPNGGTGKLPRYLFERFGSGPAKFWGYIRSPEDNVSGHRSSKATGSGLHTYVGMLSDSEDENLDARHGAGE